MSDTASADLEREAEQVRARISDTADQLRAKMSPGQMMDEVLNQFKGGDATQMLANLRTQARDNPMALAMIGSGLAWLMVGSGAAASQEDRPSTPLNSEGRQAYRGMDAAPSGYPRTGALDPIGGRTDSAGPGYAGPAEGPSLAGRMSDAAASARDAVGETLHGAGDRMSHAADRAQSAGADALGNARHAASDIGHQARRTFLDVLEREPLVIGALGVAVGAAVGALLPASELERQHLGAAGGALKDKADALVDRGVGAAREAAGELYAAARDEADRQGLVPGDKPVAERVEAVVRAAGEKARSIAHGDAQELVDASAEDRPAAQPRPKATNL